jgi:alpha-tubulin suppressor-like RCC1 family protein
MGVLRVSPWRLCGPVSLAWIGTVVIACGPGKHAGDDSASNETGDDSTSSDADTASDGDHRLVLAPPCAAFDGRVKCWGRNNRGQLGLGDTEHRGDEPGEMGDALPFVDLGEWRVMSMGMSHFYACAVLEGGKVKCWGENDYGQLGLGDTRSRGAAPGEMGAALPTVDLGAGMHTIRVTVGGGHNCALSADARVKCWGRNSRGGLGLEDVENRGDDPAEMGDALPFLNLGNNLEVVALEAGTSHTCALLSGGHVKCWGNNASGQLGLGDNEHRGDEPGEMGDALPFVDVDGEVVSIGAGNRHTCALLTDGRVQCWGANDDGQLGHEDRIDRARPRVVDLGSGAHVIQLAVGGRHACAVLADGTARCWGSNNSGQLGIGQYRSRGPEPGDMGDNLPAVDLGTDIEIVSMAPARGNFTCAHLLGDRVKCWGTNRYGELGLERTDDLGVGHEPDHVGDHLPFVDLGFAID